MTLKERFAQFMLSTPGVESIDEILRSYTVPGKQRADYLACDRNVVVEVKSIEKNPDYKIQRFLDDLASSNRLPGGDHTTLGALLSGVPDGAALFSEIRERTTKVLDYIVGKADDQTGGTKDIFNLPNALGVVVVLNEDATLLFPDISTIKLFEMLRKKRPDGSIRYVHNQVIILISEAHVIDGGEGATIFPMSTLYSDEGNNIPFATTFAEGFNRLWAAYNGAGYLESSELWDKSRPRDPITPFTVVRPTSRP